LPQDSDTNIAHLPRLWFGDGAAMNPVFKIRLLPAQGKTCRIFAEVGEQNEDIEVEGLESDLKKKLASLQEALLLSSVSRKAEIQSAPGTARRDSGAAGPEAHIADDKRELKSDPSGSEYWMIQEIGSKLFDFIFQKDIFALYKDSLKAAKGKYPLQIKLCIDAPEFSYLPWETLYDRKNRRYLSCSQETPFARAVSMEDDDRPITRRLPIRILGMAAKPKDMMGIALDPIDADTEQNTITQALKDLDTEGKVRLCWTASGTRRDLVKRLVAPDNGIPWDVLHFIGHGGFDPKRGEKGMGFIILQEEGGAHGKALYADDLKEFVVGPEQPQLVILNSCNGAALGPGDLFSSTAASLVLGGIPAVIAMQFAISDKMAIAFSNSLYFYLATGLSIQRALTLTRIDLRADGFAEWIAPVLYMRAPDGRFFAQTE
jgi:hypothetical protein